MIIKVLFCLFIEHIHISWIRLTSGFSPGAAKVTLQTLLELPNVAIHLLKGGGGILLLSPVNISVYVIKGPPVQRFYWMAFGVMK